MEKKVHLIIEKPGDIFLDRDEHYFASCSNSGEKNPAIFYFLIIFISIRSSVYKSIEDFLFLLFF
jgi:hypothetical protein